MHFLNTICSEPLNLLGKKVIKHTGIGFVLFVLIVVVTCNGNHELAVRRSALAKWQSATVNKSLSNAAGVQANATAIQNLKSEQHEQHKTIQKVAGSITTSHHRQQFQTGDVIR